MTLERDLRIRTAEHVGISYELAGIGNRMLAAFLDIVFLGIVIGGGFLVVSVILRQLNVPLSVDVVVGAVLVVLLLLAAPFAYWVALESFWNGQTLGKRIVGIRVLRDDGSPVGFFAIATRGLLRALDLVPIIFPVDIILIVASKKGQRLGDLVAGTVVVKARVERDFSTLRTRALPATAAAVTVRALSGEGQRLVREFALRESGLKPEARVNVAHSIARIIRPAIPESSEHPDDVEFLRAVAASLRETV
ncbi:MAG: hypothetical protein AUH85_05500 [Chloroflexi bacterium 13_1_40CM_4_68_4]|nr:MAG: hypothetical protein AUH85_05500 [Chloroflexi bacterium 13_1_40CM_4_68_4]